MKPKRWIALLLVPVLLGMMTFLAQASSNFSRGLYQSAQNEICYVIADETLTGTSDDSLSQVNFITGMETQIGFTGTKRVEAITFQPSTGSLFVVDGDQLGTLDISTGKYTGRANVIGQMEGDLGLLTIRDVDGIAFDPTTGFLYASERRDATTTSEDLIFRIDPVTGIHVNNAFGDHKDYIVVPGESGFYDIDDITFDIVDGTMYAIGNNQGRNDWLITLDKLTGAVTRVGIVSVNDMEGLTFNTTGQLMGTTGKDGREETRNRLYMIDKTTGKADLASSKLLTAASDYEGVTCLTSWVLEPTRTPTVTGTITTTPTTPTPTEPTAVDFLYFKLAGIEGKQINLEWATAMEVDNYGFNIYRSTSSSLAQAELIHFEPAAKESGGHVYTYTDTLQETGVYWYWLEDVDTSGGKSVHAPVLVIAQPKVFVPLLFAPSQP